ncbi:hypothetical protein SCHPADRAFT_729548 [Schizopora paradoxa]|uniref:Uncharacterized protein n=1 Tax=Schizopora paradoxa TaxID=27342 RepID=A0A0H2R0Q0_9AGAM|nr:hypothetical protein SCHPADRAFT_729548 [Schizopora paradoxa]
MLLMSTSPFALGFWGFILTRRSLPLSYHTQWILKPTGLTVLVSENAHPRIGDADDFYFSIAGNLATVGFAIARRKYVCTANIEIESRDMFVSRSVDLPRTLVASWLQMYHFVFSYRNVSPGVDLRDCERLCYVKLHLVPNSGFLAFRCFLL